MKIPVDRVAPYSYPLYRDYGTQNLEQRDDGKLNIHFRISEIERLIFEDSSDSLQTRQTEYRSKC